MTSLGDNCRRFERRRLALATVVGRLTLDFRPFPAAKPLASSVALCAVISATGEGRHPSIDDSMDRVLGAVNSREIDSIILFDLSMLQFSIIF